MKRDRSVKRCWGSNPQYGVIKWSEFYYMKWFRQLKCKHTNSETITNFCGDFIDSISLRKIYRSERRCKDCGKTFYSEFLDKDCKVINYEENM